MNYTIYELKLKPLSPWITDLTADTIFGHICWQIKYEFGKETLEEFLKEMAEKPIFTISDVLPYDRLPRPLSEFDGEIGNKDEEDFDTNKKYKGTNFIFNKDFKNYYLNKNNNLDKFWDIKREIEIKEKKEYKTINTIENKNIINRNTGTTSDNGIFSIENKFIENSYDKLRLFIKIFDKNKFKELKIEELIKNIFEISGFGKKKSTGKGVFEINEINKNYIQNFYGIENNEMNLKENNFKNIILLSNFIPSENDTTNGYYKIFTKFPKMGESNSLKGTNFYKKPLIMLDKGATFNNDNKGYVGKMIENIDFQDKGIYHYAYGFTLEF